jgi:hypothetical protein
MSYYYIGFPLLINGELALTKKLYGNIGLGINYYFGCNNVMNEYGDYPDHSSGFEKNKNININGYIGLSYYTKHNVILHLKPTYSYFLLPVYDYWTNDGEYNKLYLYSFGVEFGLGVGLGNKK